jgi:ABC-type uncharacterized transport system substrate-binding protein
LIVTWVLRPHGGQNATATIPVVMAIGEPSGSASASLAYPGGNITGFSAFVTNFRQARRLIKEAVPGVTRLGFSTI